MTLGELTNLPSEELRARALEVRRQLGATEWEMGQHLLAIELRGLHLEEGYSTVPHFAEGVLKLDDHKASEMLRVARNLQVLPLFSDAWRAGQLNWTKMRAVTQAVTPETEEAWLQFALDHTGVEVQAQVAKCQAAHLRGEPDPELPVPPPKLVRVTMAMTPAQFADWEQGIERERAAAGRCIPVAEAAVQMARRSVTSASPTSRIRHQVHLHVVGSGEGFYQTRRGMLPATPEVVEAALDEEITQRFSRGKKRSALPRKLLRALLARSGGMCECCQGPGPLDVDHLVPRSEGGADVLDNTRLHCKRCHGVRHAADYEKKEGWRKAKARRQRRATG